MIDYAYDFEECPCNNGPISSYELDHLVDHTKGLVEDIYQTGSVDDLEYHLEEICYVLGIPIPDKASRFRTQ